MSSTEDILTMIDDLMGSTTNIDPYTEADLDQIRLDDLYKIQSELEDLYEALEMRTQSVEDLIEDIQDKIDDLEEQNGGSPEDE